MMAKSYWFRNYGTPNIRGYDRGGKKGLESKKAMKPDMMKQKSEAQQKIRAIMRYCYQESFSEKHNLWKNTEDIKLLCIASVMCLHKHG